MKKFLSILLILVACKSEKVSDSETRDSRSTEAVNAETQDEITSEDSESAIDSGARVIDNNFAYHPFENEFEGILNEVGDYELEKEPFKNIHMDDQVDTILHIRFDDSSIDYYKETTQTEGIILTADIKSSRVTFKKGIKIGMSQQALLELFEDQNLDLSENIDRILVEDEEQFNSVELIFIDRKLSQVKYTGYFD